jgi:LacI family transcriptional regulator
MYVLRQKPSKRQVHRRRVVAVIVDGASTYGRSILRGVTRYANLQRRWVLHADIRPSVDSINHCPKCDGLIVAGISADSSTSLLSRSRHKIFCSGSADPKFGIVISLDDEAAGAMAAEHLIDCRLENFAFYGTSTSSVPVSVKRLTGFRSALKNQGFGCAECPVGWPSGLDWLTHAKWNKLIPWLQQLPKPVGILAADDSAAYDLAAACLQANIGVPDHVAVVGVNNDDLLCESSWPPLSSVNPDYTRMGYLAAQTMERLFAGEKLSREDRVVRLPPVEVVQRQSTSVIAVKDLNLADAIRYIREHACDPCTVDDVLQHVPVGRRWLERQFLQKLGKTPHDEIVRVRIDMARRLLVETNLRLEQIAMRCGFSAMPRFHYTFRQLTNTTPAAFRRLAHLGSADKS